MTLADIEKKYTQCVKHADLGAYTQCVYTDVRRNFLEANLESMVEKFS